MGDMEVTTPEIEAFGEDFTTSLTSITRSAMSKKCLKWSTAVMRMRIRTIVIVTSTPPH